MLAAWTAQPAAQMTRGQITVKGQFISPTAFKLSPGLACFLHTDQFQVVVFLSLCLGRLLPVGACRERPSQQQFIVGYLS